MLSDISSCPQPAFLLQGTKVFLNGKWIGIHRNPDELKSALLKLRRNASVTEDVSIVYDHALGEIRIYNDWGRVCRPLYVVENNQMKLTKADIPHLSVRSFLVTSFYYSTLLLLFHYLFSLLCYAVSEAVAGVLCPAMLIVPFGLGGSFCFLRFDSVHQQAVGISHRLVWTQTTKARR
jgi:hypothetical protein